MEKLMFANQQEVEEKIEEREREREEKIRPIQTINQAIADIIYPMPLHVFRNVMNIPIILSVEGVETPKPVTYISTLQWYFYSCYHLKDLDINVFMEKINEVIVREQIKIEEDEIDNYQALMSRIDEIEQIQKNKKTINIYQLKCKLKEKHTNFVRDLVRYYGYERVKRSIDECDEIWGD